MKKSIVIGLLLNLMIGSAAWAGVETSKILSVGVVTELVPPFLPEGIVFVALVNPGTSAACFNNQGVLALRDTERDAATKAYATLLTAKASDLMVRVSFTDPGCDILGVTITD